MSPQDSRPLATLGLPGHQTPGDESPISRISVDAHSAEHYTPLLDETSAANLGTHDQMSLLTRLPTELDDRSSCTGSVHPNVQSVGQNPEYTGEDYHQPRSEGSNHTGTGEDPSPLPGPKVSTRSSQSWMLEQIDGYWSRCGPWRWDVLALTFACALFATDIAILARYDGSGLSDWHMNISINTIVSTLSTVAIFTLMSPLGVALGQCKWLLFRREERPLSHLSHFDGASRGPLGCIKLFGSRQYYGPLPSIGALLIIMALAVNPFMQQLIRYRFRDIENGTALLPVSYGYGYGYGSTSDDDSYAGHIAMKAAVYSGFSSPGGSDFEVTSYCPSDNCTWPPFHTLGVCGSCEDLTPLVERVPIAPELFSGGGPSNFRLPNGFNMTTRTTLKDSRSPFTYMNISTTGSMYSNLYNTTDDFILNNMSIAFPDRGSLMLNFFALRLDGLSNSADNVSFAKECVLQYCVKNITAVQRKGELVETVSGTWTNNSEAARKFYKGHHLQAYSSPLYYLQPPGQERVFKVGHAAQAQMTEWLDLVLVGTAERQLPDAGQFFTTDLIHGIDRVLDQDESGLEALVSNVAGAMTAALRAESRDSASMVFVSEPYIHIDWVWIIFPLLLYVMAVAFVITVALQGRGGATRCHVWKNSIVAALCHGLEAELSGKLANFYTQEEIDEAAKDVKVKLAASAVGLQLISVEPQELLQWQAEADGAGG